jgi:hypothetical protein
MPKKHHATATKHSRSSVQLFGTSFWRDGYYCWCGFSIWGLSLVLDDKATIDVDGVPSSDPWEKAIVLVVGLMAVVTGILVFRARPYHPKE